MGHIFSLRNADYQNNLFCKLSIGDRNVFRRFSFGVQ